MIHPVPLPILAGLLRYGVAQELITASVAMSTVFSAISVALVLLRLTLL